MIITIIIIIILTAGVGALRRPDVGGLHLINNIYIYRERDVYIYIYIEREREMYIYICIYACMRVYI